MQELPQQPPDYEALAPYDQSVDGSIISDDIPFQVLEFPTPPTTKLEEKDLFCLTKYLSEKYKTGFTWTELPHIIEKVSSYVGPNPEMTTKEKHRACIEVIHYLMVSLESLYLPEKATDPFFEHLIDSFFILSLGFEKERALITPSLEGEPTDASVLEYSEKLHARFESEGMSWKNLSLSTKYAMTYALSYKDLPKEMQIECAYAIVESLLAKSGQHKAPPYFDEKLFKIFLKSFIETSLSK